MRGAGERMHGVGRQGRGAGNKMSASLEFIEVAQYLKWDCGKLVPYQAIAGLSNMGRPSGQHAYLYSVQHIPQQPKLNKVFLEQQPVDHSPRKSYHW